MNPDRDVEARLGRWLKDEAAPMPAHVLEAVRDALPRASQLGEPRFTVPRPWDRWYGRLGLAAAAAILVVVGAPAAFDELRSILRWSSGAGPSLVVPSPSPSARPTPEASAPATAEPAGADPFTGRWSSIDVDGSVTTLSFEGSGLTRTVVTEDLRATGCAGAHYINAGSGTIAGLSLHAVGSGGCAGQPIDKPFDQTWTYHPEAGTLTAPLVGIEGADVYTWTRGETVDAFSGVWGATGVDGSPLTLTFGDSGMTRDVTFVDGRSSYCAGGGAYTATGTATIGSVSPDGRYVTVAVHGSCSGGGSPGNSVEKYKYDFATGTLIGPLAPLSVGGNPLPTTVTWQRP
jgi:hypothetical protein